MEHVKATTKKGEYLIWRAKQNIGYDLDDVYSSYSSAKHNAWMFWWKFVHDNNMRNFHICSKNCMTFSLSFEDDSHVYVITRHHNYCVDLTA